MGKFDKVMASISECLYGDERLRSNLTDSESKIILMWAENWIRERTNMARDETMAKQIAQNELTRACQVLQTINALAKNPGAPRLTDAVGALDAALKGGKPLTREETFGALTALTGAVWKMRAK
jgi:hypothetical protein